MNKSNLSVIVPVGGGRLNNLANVLYSLQIQTLLPGEVIIVDDGSGDDVRKVLRQFENHLELRYIETRKFRPLSPINRQWDLPPRSKGARLARFPHLVFLDSDVIVDKQALSFFAEDYNANPLGVVAGIYDWLPPCRVEMEDIAAGLDTIYQVDGDDLKLNLPQLPWPDAEGQTHNVCRDIRRPMFYEANREQVFTGPGNMNVYLGAFSGLLGIEAGAYWEAGGYWPDLTAGLVDDGAFGLTLWVKSFNKESKDTDQRFGMRLDQRIVGAHQYHGRNVQWVVFNSAKEVDVIDRRFRLNKYADGGDPILPDNLANLTANAQKAWGVDKWAKDW